MTQPCIVLLAGEGTPTCMVYHALRRRFGSAARLEVILERPVSRLHLLKRRAKRLGLVPVLGHVLFMMLAVPLLRFQGRQRIEAIQALYGLDDSVIPEPVLRVASANSAVVVERLRALSPSVVVVNGTRILKPEILSATGAPFINMHAGVTPAYRGVHGGYWALADGRPELVGTTIHLVDEGIDTGDIVKQVIFTPTAADNFATYPYLHIAMGLPALLDAVQAILSHQRPALCAPQTRISRLWHHPTLWSYLKVGCRQNVW
ncbi:MAG: formyl transferase [Pirellulales bacterium]